MNKLILVALAVLSVGAAVAAAEAHLGAPDDKIAEAMLPAPAELSSEATILDWPEAPGAEFPVLREGTNGWYCLPDYPQDTSFAPECFDEEWRKFVRAYVDGTVPELDGLGLSYMLGARWAVSNTDRTATAPTPDNQWHEGGSHLMLAVPDPALLEWFPTEPTPRGGAYVMFGGTPYAHLMIPIPEAHAGEG